jgi:hypothetical protein
MANVAHFQITDAAGLFIASAAKLRARHGVIKHRGPEPGQWGTSEYLYECEHWRLARDLLRDMNNRQATLREFNLFFSQIVCDWALVGPRELTIEVPTTHRNGVAYHELRNWINASCEGEVSIMSATYARRINFASEDDYVLARLTLV